MSDRRWLGIGAVTLASLALLPSTVVASAGTPRASATWSVVTTLAGGRGVFPYTAGLACPSTTLCIAAVSDYYSTKNRLGVSTDGGTHWRWHAVTLPSYVEFTGVSCESTKVCVAIAGGWPFGSSTRTYGYVFETTNGGGSWQQASLPPTTPFLASVSCVRGACEIAGGAPVFSNESPVVQSPAVVLRMVGTGPTWTAQTLPPVNASPAPAVFTVRCTSVSACVLLGEAPLIGGETGLAVRTTHNGGATWTVVQPDISTIETAGTFGYESGCTNLVDCWIDGGYKDDGVTPATVFVTSDGFTTAPTQTIAPGVGGEPTGIACPSATHCQMVLLRTSCTYTTRVVCHTWAGLIAGSASFLGPWHVEHTPNGIGTIDGALACPSVRWCLAGTSANLGPPVPGAHPANGVILRSS